MKNKITTVAIIFLGVLFTLIIAIVCLTNQVAERELIEENEALSSELDKAKEEALELKMNLLTSRGELNKAKEDLQSCSFRMEELETIIYNKDIEIDNLAYELEYYDEMEQYIYNGNWNYYYDEDDVEILAGVMYGENWISGRYEMMLTGSVVLNRVLDDRFPNNIHDVVYQIDGGYEQYAPRTKRLIGSDEVPEICYDLAKILLENGPICPNDVIYQAHFNQGEVFWEYKGEEFCYG